MRATNQIAVLVKTQNVEIVELCIPAGSRVPTYEAAGEIIIHCLKGRIQIGALGDSRELRASQLIYLHINEAFSIEAIENASVLATIVSAKSGSSLHLIGEPSPK